MAISKFSIGITLASVFLMAGLVYGTFQVFGPRTRSHHSRARSEAGESVAANADAPLVHRTTQRSDNVARAAGDDVTVRADARPPAPGQIMDAKTFLDREFSQHVYPEVKGRPELQHHNREEYEREMQAIHPDLARNAEEDRLSDIAQERAQREQDREEAERKRTLEESDRKHGL
jgi:hypothetical protein